MSQSVHPPFPFVSFFIPPCLGVLVRFSFSFFLCTVSVCLPFLDATIRNVYFDGRVSEELICLIIGLCAAPHHEDISTGRKAWDQVENISMHIVKIHIHQ